ncbi:MAG: ribonuclease P protein component [Microthrixaceae bacterium]
MTVALAGEEVAPTRPQLWRITDRATFDALRRQGRRGRDDALTVTWLPPTAGSAVEPPRAAFAISCASGNAVTRNRIRRRLRAALRLRAAAGTLPGGAYLLSGSASLADLPWTELVVSLERALTAAGAVVAP